MTNGGDGHFGTGDTVWNLGVVQKWLLKWEGIRNLNYGGGHGCVCWLR